MNELNRFGETPRSSLVPMSSSRRTMAAYRQSALAMRADAALEEEKARLAAQFVENRIMDAHEVATFAQAAMQTDLDRALILPIVQAYGLNAQRSVMNFGREL